MFNEEAYLGRRIAGWERLERLMAQGGPGLRASSGPEMVEVVRLYRQASADLAYLSTHSSNADVVNYLNNLVGRSYAEIYRRPRRAVGEAVARALATGARTVRKRSPEIAFGVSVFFAGMAFAWLLMAFNPSTREYFVPAEAEENFAHWRQGAHEFRPGGDNIAAAAMYSTNNPMVGIMMIGASLATGGLMGVSILWQNGTGLGALAADMQSVGKLSFLFTSILPHGVSEVGGIFVASGAAFLLGRTLLAPGNRTRSAALREAGPDAAALSIVGLVMILLAAPIEGFFSFNPAIPQGVKLVVGLVALAAWLAYFLGYAKDPDAPGVS